MENLICEYIECVVPEYSFSEILHRISCIYAQNNFTYATKRLLFVQTEHIKPKNLLSVSIIFMPEIKIMSMVLTDKEKAVSLISNAIVTYSLFSEKGVLPEKMSLIDFILNSVPNELKSMISIDLIDEVFEFVSKAKLDHS